METTFEKFTKSDDKNISRHLNNIRTQRHERRFILRSRKRSLIVDKTNFTRTFKTVDLFIFHPHQTHKIYNINWRGEEILLQHMFQNRWQHFEFFCRRLFSFVCYSIFLGCLLHFLYYTHNQIIIVTNYVNILGRSEVNWILNIFSNKKKHLVPIQNIASSFSIY